MMMDRIRWLRKSLGLTQKDFAEKIQLKGNAISMLEQGRCSLTEQNIRLICMAFGVSEEWLRTGAGAMFGNEKALGAQELLDTYRELYPENKKFVLSMIKQLLETQRSMMRTADMHPPSAGLENPPFQC
jgi:transcriptional regulator with XRE-family HTH domain